MQYHQYNIWENKCRQFTLHCRYFTENYSNFWVNLPVLIFTLVYLLHTHLTVGISGKSTSVGSRMANHSGFYCNRDGASGGGGNHNSETSEIKSYASNS